jgi:hypothetical protein
MGKKKTLPAEDQVLAEISRVVESNPEFGIKRVSAAVKESNPEWSLSEKRGAFLFLFLMDSTYM